MAQQEIAFEYMALALETTRGTAITPPTHYLPFAGTVTPTNEIYRPEESRGTLVRNYRSKVVRKGAEWEGEGGLDPNYAPLIFNLITTAVTSPATPTNGVLTRLWTFTPTITSDAIKSATIYFGDPNMDDVMQAAYCMAEELNISADASGTDGVTWTINGMGQFPTLVAPPTLPAQSIGDLLMPGAMQMWLDTSSAIGTTEVTGRLVSTDWTIPTGVSFKHRAVGPTGGLGFGTTGRGKREATASVVVEFTDDAMDAEYAHYAAGTVVKLRVRLNGSLIESVTPDYYSYVQLDIYGTLSDFEWGDLESTNRTMGLTVTSQYDSTAGADYKLYVQNTKTAL
jgi:hypothetical protein